MEMPYVNDCRALLSDIKKQDKLLRLKRRWLMDLPLSYSEQKRMKKQNFLMDKSIPETLIREDDIYHDNIKLFVERGFGVKSVVEDHFLQRNLRHNCGSYGHQNNISSLLHKMTNYGLCCLADLVIEGTVKYEKTRWKMKKIIREYLPIFLSEMNNNFQMREEKITNLLKDPRYFRGNHTGLCSPTEAFRAAAIEVLNKLEQFPPQALGAMYRKLKGEKGYLPSLVHRKSPRRRDLIGPVRNCCLKMLLELDEMEEPQEPLAKALGVASLTLKLILGCPSVIELRNFSPEVEALQNDIAMAIELISSEKKVSLVKLEALCKKLDTFPDANFKISRSGLRSAVRYLFIEYLLECSDMDVIPEYLLEALSEINTNHCSFQSSLKEKIEEEVECLLCLSAQTKQIVWDLLPDLEVDFDFSDAYMEEGTAESDDDDEEEVELSKNCKFCSHASIGLTEGMGETHPSATPNSMLNIKLETMNSSEWDAIQSHNFSNYSSSPESKMFNQRQRFNIDKCHLEGWGRSILPDLLALGKPANQNQSDFSSAPSGLECDGGHEVKRQQTIQKTTENLELLDSDLQSGGMGNFHPKQCTTGNWYLSIQKACDETTMVMYSIVGSMLNEFAQDEHLDLTRGDIRYLQSHAHHESKEFQRINRLPNHTKQLSKRNSCEVIEAAS